MIEKFLKYKIFLNYFVNCGGIIAPELTLGGGTTDSFIRMVFGCTFTIIGYEKF